LGICTTNLAQRFSSAAQFQNLLITNLSKSFEVRQSELVKNLQYDFLKTRPKFIFLLSSVQIYDYLPDLLQYYSQKELKTPFGGYLYLERLNQ
jgi:hypothetical protein